MLKQPKPLTNANLKSHKVLRPNVSLRLAFAKGLGCFSIAKAMTYNLQKKPAARIIGHFKFAF